MVPKFDAKRCFMYIQNSKILIIVANLIKFDFILFKIIIHISIIVERTFQKEINNRKKFNYLSFMKNVELAVFFFSLSYKY